jgi:hypothetical protein
VTRTLEYTLETPLLRQQFGNVRIGTIVRPVQFLPRSGLRSLDFSSLHSLFTTLISLAAITLLGVGIRLVTQTTIQQRRERMNRQINERLRALMAASPTKLSADPSPAT